MKNKEGAQKGAGIPLDEAECRKKRMNRGKRCSKEMQESLKESLQHQVQDVEKRRNDLILEHQKAQKRTQKIQSLQDKRRNLQKESLTATEEMRKFSEEIVLKEESFGLLADNVVKNRIADAELEAELQG